MSSKKRKRGHRKGFPAGKKHQYNEMSVNNHRVSDKSKILKQFKTIRRNNARNDEICWNKNFQCDSHIDVIDFGVNRIYGLGDYTGEELRVGDEHFDIKHNY